METQKKDQYLKITVWDLSWVNCIQILRISKEMQNIKQKKAFPCLDGSISIFSIFHVKPLNQGNIQHEEMKWNRLWQ